LKKYRKEMLEVLQFAPHIMEHVHKTQNSILKKVRYVKLLLILHECQKVYFEWSCPDRKKSPFLQKGRFQAAD